MYKSYTCPYYEYMNSNSHNYYPYNMCDNCEYRPCPNYYNQHMPLYKRTRVNPREYDPYVRKYEMNDDFSYDYSQIYDYGPEPFLMNIEEATENNQTFRTALWTGDNLQLVIMSIPPGEEIGLERHPNTDQFFRIEDGKGIVYMGDQPGNLDFKEMVREGDAFIIPANKWHNVVNTGDEPLQLYTIYSPPEHPFGTVQETKEEAVEQRNQ